MYEKNSRGEQVTYSYNTDGLIIEKRKFIPLNNNENLMERTVYRYYEKRVKPYNITKYNIAGDYSQSKDYFYNKNGNVIQEQFREFNGRSLKGFTFYRYNAATSYKQREVSYGSTGLTTIDNKKITSVGVKIFINIVMMVFYLLPTDGSYEYRYEYNPRGQLIREVSYDIYEQDREYKIHNVLKL